MFKLNKLPYTLISITIALLVIVTNIPPSYGQSWQELIFRGIQIIQISNLNDRQEVEIGNQIRQELLQRGQIRPFTNPELQSYIDDIGRRLVRVSDRPNLPYTFTVVNNPQINAFATMGGFVYLHTGLLDSAENEAQLASVMAHEIAHVTARHSQKQIRQQALTQGLLSASGLNSSQVVRLGVTLAVSLPHSRQDEFEADNLGLQMLKSAGYAPQGMVDFMVKLGQKSGNTPTLLSTHPNGRERAIALSEQIPPFLRYEGYGLDNESYRLEMNRFLRRR